MPSVTPEDLKKIITQRIKLQDEAYVTVPLPDQNSLMFQVRWWGQYRTYQAIPVVPAGDSWFIALINMDETWFRYIKRKLRATYGVRHVANINQKDNAQRVEQLLGVRSV